MFSTVFFSFSAALLLAIFSSSLSRTFFMPLLRELSTLSIKPNPLNLSNINNMSNIDNKSDNTVDNITMDNERILNDNQILDNNTPSDTTSDGMSI